MPNDPIAARRRALRTIRRVTAGVAISAAALTAGLAGYFAEATAAADTTTTTTTTSGHDSSSTSSDSVAPSTGHGSSHSTTGAS